MADTSTPFYSFTLPEVGGSRNTWGTKNNANWEAVDAILAGKLGSLSSVAGTNTITASTTFTYTAYTAADVFVLVPAGNNTGAATININSLGARNIYQNGTVLGADVLVSGRPVIIRYNGTQFELVGAFDIAKLSASSNTFAGEIVTGGNVGVGVTPETWNTAGKAIEVGNNGNGLYSSSVNTLYMLSNAYLDSSGDFRYSNTGTATRLQHQAGEILIFTAPSGTAGDICTFTETGRFSAGGNLLLGATTGSFAPGGKGVLVNNSTGASFRAECGAQAGEVFCTPTQFALSSRTSIPVAIQVAGNQVAQYNTAGYYKASNSGTYLTAGGSFHELVNDTGTAGAIVATLWNRATSGDNGFFEFYTEGTATLRGSIDYNRGGGVTRYNTTSDATLKNILSDADLQESVDIVMGCRLRKFAWKNDETQRPQIGVIAQEEYEHFKGSVAKGGWVEEVIPAITESVMVKDETYVVETGETIPAQYAERVIEPEKIEKRYDPWGVDKTAYVWHLVGTCQKQQADINALTDKLERLERKIRKLTKSEGE